MQLKQKAKINFNKKSSPGSTDKSNNLKLYPKKDKTNTKNNSNNSIKKSNSTNKCKKNSINKSPTVKSSILIEKIKSTDSINNSKSKHKNSKDLLKNLNNNNKQ